MDTNRNLARHASLQCARSQLITARNCCALTVMIAVAMNLHPAVCASESPSPASQIAPPGRSVSGVFNQSKFTTGLEGWEVTSGSVKAWLREGGYINGHMRTVDSGPTEGYILSPAKFLGDWSLLDGVGYVGFYQRLADADGELPEMFPKVMITGPGGTASYTWDSFPTDEWQNYCVRLDEALWDVVGVWGDILADVTELSIRADVTPGMDENRFDGIYLGEGPCHVWDPIPDQALSTVPCLRVCPEGGFDFFVTVRNKWNYPVTDTEVRVDFANCPAFQFCHIDGSETYELEPGRTVVSRTDAAGVVGFWIRGGGVTPDPLVTVRADTVQLAAVPMASCDQDGDLTCNAADAAIIQGKILAGTYDPTAEFLCDGVLTFEDLVPVGPHVSEQHTCLPLAVDVEEASSRGHIALYPSIPNPVRGRTLIRFDLAVPMTVSLIVYDVRGRVVREALNSLSLPAGRHQWTWDGTGAGGLRVPPGVYFYALESGKLRSAQKTLVVQ